MAHTNSTPNYNLPQFVTTDKPAWLTDINGAFSAIDTAIDAAKDAADNAQGDATQAASDASDALTAATAADGKGGGAVSSIAAAFDPTSTYTVGSLVMYNNLLYKCVVAVTTPGAWTGTTNWNRATIAELESGNYSTLNSKIDDNTAYKAGDTIDIGGTYLAGALSNGRYRFNFNIPLPKKTFGRTVSLDGLSFAIIGNGQYLPNPTGLVTTPNVSACFNGVNVVLFFSVDYSAALNVDEACVIRIISGNLNFT